MTATLIFLASVLVPFVVGGSHWRPRRSANASRLRAALLHDLRPAAVPVATLHAGRSPRI
jgi:hypothetical protein